MRRTIIAIFSIALLVTVRGAAPDWPQFLGPDRNGVYAGPPLARSWPAEGPRVVWKKQVGAGFAGPVVSGGRVVLLHRVGNEEAVESFEAGTGKPQWRHAYPTAYRDDFGFDEGPRAAPVVANGRVYTFGAEGKLHALDLATGRVIWSEDTRKRFAVPKGFFGAAGSPLVEGGRVIANIGGTDGTKSAGIVAFNAETGAILWTSTMHQASYSSPVGATIDGQRRAIFLTRQALVVLEPATGQIVAQRPFRSRSQSSVNAASPLVVGNQIFVSATYETGAAVLQLEGNQLKPLWQSDEALSNHYATSIYSNGNLYGFHGRQEFNPSFRAVDFKTGAVKWSEDKFHAGTVTLAGDRLLILRETGELLMAQATPEAFRPLGRAQILPATLRSYPALSDGFLYARNSDTRSDTLVCIDLR